MKKPVKKLLALLALSSAFWILQACVVEPETKEVIVTQLDTLVLNDTLTLNDTLFLNDTITVNDTVRDTVTRADTISRDTTGINGTWLITNVRIDWTDTVGSGSDTIPQDTASAFTRRYYVIRNGSIFSVSYSLEDGGTASVTRFVQVGTNRWVLGEKDTLTVTLNGDNLRLEQVSFTLEGTEVIVMDMVRHRGAFPPVEWYAAPGGESEPNNTPAQATAVVIGATALEGYLAADDNDWYSFQPVAGHTYLVRTFGATDTYLELYNTAGTVVLAANDDYNSSLNAGVVWTCPSTGTYYFRVQGYYDATTQQSETGAYTVSAALNDPVVLPKASAQKTHTLRRRHILDEGK